MSNIDQTTGRCAVTVRLALQPTRLRMGVKSLSQKPDARLCSQLADQRGARETANPETLTVRRRSVSAMGIVILHDWVQVANRQQWLYAMAVAMPLRSCPLGRMLHVPYALVPQRISCSNPLDSHCDAFLPACRACSSRSRCGRLHHPEAVERLGIHNLRCESRPAGRGVAPVAKTFFRANVTFSEVALSRGAAGSTTQRERIHR